MPVDASIPLQAQQPKFMTPQQAVSLQSAVQARDMGEIEMQQIQEKIGRQKAAREIMADPQSMDPTTGAPTLASIAKLSQVDPELGQKMSHQRTVTLQQLQLGREQNLAYLQKRRSETERIVGQAVSAYDLALQRTGGNQQEAAREATRVRNQGIDELRKSGAASAMGLSDEDIDRKIAEPIDINRMRSMVTKPEDLARRSEPKSNLGKLEADFKAGRVSKADYDAEKKKMTAPTAAMGAQGQFEGKSGELLAALAERGVSLPTGFRSKEQQVALLNGLLKRNPNSSPDEIAEKVKAGKIDLAATMKATQVAGGIAGKVAYAENEIEQTIPLVREASAKLPRGQFIPYNKLKQMGETAFSNPDLAEFRMYMTSLSNAYDMLAARGGTDVEKRAEARRNFETAQSPEALDRVLQAVRKEAQASGRAAAASMKPPGSEGGSIEDKAKSAWGSYEPDKYDYRVGPSGTLQRKAK